MKQKTGGRDENETVGKFSRRGRDRGSKSEDEARQQNRVI